MSNYPDGCTQRDHDRAFAGDDLHPDRICEQCARELEYCPDNAAWYYAGAPYTYLGDLIEAKGVTCCSQRCLSEWVYRHASNEEQALLRLLVVLACTWHDEANASSTTWLLERSGVYPLVDASDLRLLDGPLRDVLDKLCGPGYAAGKQEVPDWVAEVLDGPAVAGLIQ